jgi:hypothetical protein
MKRFIDWLVGTFSFLFGVLLALVSDSMRSDSFLSIFTITWRSRFVEISGIFLALAAIGLLVDRRLSAILGIVAGSALGTYYLFPASLNYSPGNFIGSAISFSLSLLLYRRFGRARTVRAAFTSAP